MVENLTNALLASSTNILKEPNKTQKNLDTQSTKIETSQSQQNINIDQKLNNILKSLSSDLLSGKKSLSTVSDLLKNSSMFKDLSKMAKNLDSLILILKSNPKMESQVKALEQFSIQIKDLDATKLKQQLQNSGILLESKLKNISQVDIKMDIKAILLQVQKELSSSSQTKDIDTLKTTEKLLTQIDINQLQSLSANNLSLYMPFLWDMCDDANIELKKHDEDKFRCDIRLKLKDYGDINLSIILHDTNKIDLSFYTQTSDFKELVRDNVQDLKKKINEVGLTVSSTKLLDLKKNDNPYSSKNDDLDLDLDIKA